MKRPRRQDDHAWSQLHLSHATEGDLSRRQRRRFDGHLARCPQCRRGLQSLEALVRALTRLHDAPAPGVREDIYIHLRDRILNAPPPPGLSG
ncbi:zf-HC2 domain-containing protein [Paraconexibacter antarcticus]|uniref:Zf-HC2 domain-containing protein n=1 Tax=Paraconexibacter antarcticus TaxID=2949664 RepID=A0ABY5DT63_9ACTN|nr:zf-HC2 domain-containing protein [Paraconexibacter antarcticus]UTI64007.1 zf-HC2 domain-containing protein [Paraconexibacter antarcticus]